ncbi:uncharacterized protein LOC110914153 [Helianthus annuus]|uniref:uncharacterized protein LOC110914153 n=1 Tax=Helianthus annuus TaxID=4232 RepID=UPI000B8F65BD|nr:uncharacterized protein LOC110914153 [Helianthus annuus]
MDRTYQPEFNEFEGVDFSQHNRPMHQQMNFQNRQSPTQNRYARYDVGEVDGYYDQFGCDGYNDFAPPPQQFIQRGQNRVSLGEQRFNNAQQNSYGRSSVPAEGPNDEIMEMLKQMKKDLELRAKAYQALDKQVAQLVIEVKEVADSRDQDNYESNWQTQENEQAGQHESDDNSINEKFDTIMEFLKDIQKSNEVRDREVKALSQQGVEGVADEINGSECKNEHDQEIKSFTKSINGSNGKLSEIESPDHVECLEELSNNKRRHKFPKQLNLSASVNAVLMGTSPPKTQDPGTPVISIQIGDVKLDMALLDLGSCVSILPGSLYDQYDFGSLQKVKTTVVLADQTPIGLRGIIKNVIVKVGEFYYPLDFLVLDYAKNAQPTIILGRPFLATTKAIINCAEGTVRMRFGDTKMSLKLFSNSPNHKTDKCGSPEKENQTEKKECFMTDRVLEDKAKKKSKKRKRKNAKEVLEFDCYREACKWYDQVWEETDGENRTNSGAEGRKHPTRPP